MSELKNMAVFLSYASQDANAARRIAEALREAGIEVWFDQNELVGGDAWDQKIRRQVKSCALFVPIISANTQARPEGYFRLEWRIADQRTHLMGRNKAFVVPVCIDDTPDAGADVPDSFLAVQWTRLPGGQTSSAVVEHFLRLLGGDIGCFVDHRNEPPSTASMAGFGDSALQRKQASSGNSVAVLAFANLSNEADNEFFSDGISEELINVLVRVPNLKVSARTSAFHFKGKHTPIPEIARQLGVAYVVEGSVRKAGERVRITAQLIKAADGFHVWSDTFTRDLKDIFAVQDEIAGLIAESLSVKLTVPNRVAREIKPAAHRLYLEGHAIFAREVPAEYPLAIERFKQSLELDSGSGVTWARLAVAYFMAGSSGTMSVGHGNQQGRAAAQRAMELEPDMPNGYQAMAFAEIFFGWNWSEAAALIARALELAPGDVDAISLQSMLQGTLGRLDEAIRLARRANELDPLNYLSSYALARSLMYAGRFAESEAVADRMITLSPSRLRSRLFLATSRLLQGRIDEAAAAAELVPVAWARHTALGCARFAQGRRTESDAALAELKANDAEHAPYQIGQVHAFRGELDDAFAWLDKGYAARDAGMALMKCDPLLNNVRHDPRWAALLRKMGLADDQLGWARHET